MHYMDQGGPVHCVPKRGETSGQYLEVGGTVQYLKEGGQVYSTWKRGTCAVPVRGGPVHYLEEGGHAM